MTLKYGLLVLSLILLSRFAAASSTPLHKPEPSSPKRLCEFKLSSWCVAQGAWKVSRQYDEAYPNSVVWTLAGREDPKSELVVIAPDTCSSGYSDEAVAIGFISNFKWDGRSWFKMSVRIKVDGSCDLQVLVPVYNQNSEEWAFSTGRLLVWTCRDEECRNAITIADATDDLRKNFEKGCVKGVRDNFSLPPSSAPSLSVPATSNSGSYTVSWGGVAGATSYTLQEQVNGGGWTTVQANGNTSWSTSGRGRGRGNGTYGYHAGKRCQGKGVTRKCVRDNFKQTATVIVPGTFFQATGGLLLCRG